MRLQPALKMVLWIVPLLFQPVIALAMIIRSLVLRFPLFFLYSSLVSARDLALFLTRSHIRLYAWIYWLGEPVAILLGLAVVYEVLWHLVRPYPTLRLFGVRLFWISLGIATLTGFLMIRGSPVTRTSISIESVFWIERSARFVQVGVLVVFILFISRLGLTWKDYTAGIVAGFGTSAGLQLAVLELKSLDAINDNIFVLLRSAAYDCGVLIWTLYFVQRPTPTDIPSRLPETDLARWDEVLRRYLNR